ncbi:hypothetical protein ASE67_06465 [Sphingomonas sp. Leaf23]|uniref:hypothetical protein n=1 Tax=Sphingomonas sp. Leaf23 TaxID=1735689 RepID=UPI0006FCF127|nr:hypothetical protein [Sphingomonas sp. Leaf23]KQM87356.1 hypothetical protein ASE67_06465 [Sphingomonas sp. Leaf23]
MKGPVTMTIGLGTLLLLSACGGGGDTAVEANAAAPAAPVETPAEAPVAPATPMVTATATPAASAQEQSFQAFWTKFRAAALANDAAGLAALSAPVVMQHGDLDDSPKVRLNPAQVGPVLRKLLDNPDNTNGEGQTQRQLVEATTTAKVDPNWAKDRVRIGDMEFALGKNGWRLDQIYYESYD